LRAPEEARRRGGLQLNDFDPLVFHVDQPAFTDAILPVPGDFCRAVSPFGVRRQKVGVQRYVMERLDVHEYFESPETVRPMELVYGVVREPAMPGYAHQRTATRHLALLYPQVERQGSGEVRSPLDVVLDKSQIANRKSQIKKGPSHTR
jgi:hypothetical protein